MSWDHVLWAARRATVPDSTAHHVLMAVAIHANVGGHAWPGLDTIAAQTHLNRDTVRKAVRRLEHAGTIDVIHRHGRSCEFVFPNIHNPAVSSRHPAVSSREPIGTIRAEVIRSNKERAAPADPEGPAPLNVASALPDWMLERLNRQTGAGR